MVEWNVNRILNLFKFLLRQNQSGSISTGDLFNAWNTEQFSYHSDLLGPWERMSNSKAGANTGLIMNETIMTKLSPFTIAGSVTITGGQATKPTDFIYGLARRLELNGDEFLVTKINHGQKWYVNNDAIDPPSVADGTYYIIEYENYYDVLPTTATGNLQLDYIAKPENISWGFTYDAQNRPVYNAGLSVQPKWNDSTIIEITKRALVNFGVSYKDKDFTNFGKANIQTGDS